MNADEEVNDPNYNPEEEVVGCDFKIIDLPEVKIETGEENEEILFSTKSKLYRWADEQWKERGVGELKIIENKTSSVVRCFLRQEQTMKLRCMFEVVSTAGCVLEKLKTAEKSWFWSCVDYSEGKAKVERLCARFKTNEDSELFATEFAKALEANKKIHEKKKEKKVEVKEEKKEEGKQETKTEETKEEVV